MKRRVIDDDARTRRLPSLLAAAVLLLGCGTPRVLPPRKAPARTMPRVSMPAAPPAEGMGRLVIDTTDGPMDVAARNVERFQGAASRPSRSGPLCRTPCVVDLPLGRYTLYFSGLRSDPARGDVADVEVHPGINVLRRAPGKYETPEYIPPVPVLLIVGGGVGMAAGGAVMAGGEGTGGGVLFGGGVALGIGGVIAWPHRAEQQDGSSTHWIEPMTTPRPEKGP